ncbi:phosphatidylserine decarboxylase [Kitasatospora sp. NPDC086801]|uniref:phosphatidylserine decarboxylase n=1 Tax=Kitasatospora sp. NPDC086801 TaxID=3364066 RepID=UPI00382AF934
MSPITDSFSKTIKEFLDNVRRLYNDKTSDFKDKFEKAIEGVQLRPDGTPDDVWKDWRGADIETLCSFFKEWYDWGLKQGVHEGLNYIEKFSWINYQNPAGMEFVTSGSGRDVLADFTNLQGLQMDDPSSATLVQKWIKDLGPKTLADYEKGDWSTFNKFFIRELAPGARPIDGRLDPSVVVAPTDCVVNMIVDELTDETPIPVKTVTMNVRQLLGGSKYAEHFTRDKQGKPGGGTAVSCILMPDTYHRYHAPVGGEVVEARDDIGGVYYGMRDFPALLDKGNVGYGYDYGPFADFRRGYVVIRTPYVDHEGNPDGDGYVALVPVGLNSIGSVKFVEKFRNITGDAVPVEVKKGEEIGCFQYGGSLNILLFEKGRFPALQLLMGQRIGVLEEVKRAERLFENFRRTQPRRIPPVS